MMGSEGGKKKEIGVIGLRGERWWCCGGFQEEN